MKHTLTIAGSDSGGGAGIQADIKTFSALGTYGMSVITAVTAQNTLGVSKVVELDQDIIKAQIDAVFSDIPVHAVKIGMVANSSIIVQIAQSLKEWQGENIVVDPVMVAKSGHHLLQPEAKETLIKELLPLATVITPNLPEAEVILNRAITRVEDMEWAAIDIFKLGAKNVLIKGGHLEGDPVDVFYNGDKLTKLGGSRIDKKNTHGTGCTLSAAIAAFLANGLEVIHAVAEAKKYLTGAIQEGFTLGRGIGPVHHFYRQNAK